MMCCSSGTFFFKSGFFSSYVSLCAFLLAAVHGFPFDSMIYDTSLSRPLETENKNAIQWRGGGGVFIDTGLGSGAERMYGPL